jgi:hypothetical protein
MYNNQRCSILGVTGVHYIICHNDVAKSTALANCNILCVIKYNSNSANINGIISLKTIIISCRSTGLK